MHRLRRALSLTRRKNSITLGTFMLELICVLYIDLWLFESNICSKIWIESFKCARLHGVTLSTHVISNRSEIPCKIQFYRFWPNHWNRYLFNSFVRFTSAPLYSLHSLSFFGSFNIQFIYIEFNYIRKK